MTLLPYLTTLATRGKKYGKIDPFVHRKISESKKIRGGMGNLGQYLHKHQREG